MNDEPSTNPFNITREEILELAATKLADRYDGDAEELNGTAEKLIKKRVEEKFATSLSGKIDTFLVAEMEKLLSTEVVPVDIWGKSTGEPTTLRAALHKRAMEFWEMKVNDKGVASDYYSSKSRHEWLFSKIVNDEFTAAVKQNIVNLVGAFKDAVSAHAVQITKEHIDSIIKVKTSRD